MSETPGPTRRRALVKLVAILAAMAALYVGVVRWNAHWQPDRADWPVQGVAVGAGNEPVEWSALARAGASFAYIDERGTAGVNRMLDRQIAAARAAGLRTGVAYAFSLCPNWNQSAEFVTRVARDPAMLPPMILLTLDEGCQHLPSRAALLSELSTFLTQVETHVGMAAIIAPDAGFEARYAVRGTVDRALLAPATAWGGAPEGEWTLWLANDDHASAGSEAPVRWLVARDGAFVTGGDAR